MYELIITMHVPSDISPSVYEEKHKYYSENINELFELVKLSIKLSKFEIEYSIREIKEDNYEE